MTRPSGSRNSSLSVASATQRRPVTSNTGLRRLEAVSSGAKMRKLRASMFSRMMSRTNAPSTVMSCASTAPGAGTGCSYVRKSGMRSSRSSSPPLAWGFAPMRRCPFGASACSSGMSVPLSSKSSSGW